MYPSHLGKFNVPTGGDWVPGVTYQPEPPISTPGYMNPWALERQRELFTAEEKAWVEIQKLQRSYKSIMAAIQFQMNDFNSHIERIESLTGKKSGISQITNYASMMYSFSGGPYAWAASLLKFGVDIAMSFIKKRKLKKLMKELEEIQAKLLALSARIEKVQADVTKLVQTGETIRSAQSVKVSADVKATETAYAKRQELDSLRASVLRERNRQAAALPRLAPGGPNYATI